MEKNARLPAFLSFLCALSLLLGLLAIAMSCAAAREPSAPCDPVGDTLAVSGTPEDMGDQDPSDGDEAPRHPAPDSGEQAPSGLTNSDPSAHEPTGKDEPTLTYTVKLLPQDTSLPGTCALGIYDRLGALVEQHALVLVSLTSSDRLSLQAGIDAPDLESARQLVTDFCE